MYCYLHSNIDYKAVFQMKPHLSFSLKISTARDANIPLIWRTAKRASG